MKLIRKVNNLPLQKKFVLVYCATTLLILVINIYMYANINAMMHKLDQIYVSNINLNTLSASLEQVQSNMTNYLNTKTTDAMNGYYKACQEYSNLIEELNDEITSNDFDRMEHNIKSMSQEYLELTDDAIEAKRGRNVEKYNEYFNKATVMYGYVDATIDALNNQQFKRNSENYSMLSISLRYLEVVNSAIFIAVALLNVLLVIQILHKITSPLKLLSEVADEVASGNFEVELLPVSSTDEVGVVSKAFNQMIINIKEYIQQIKQRMETERLLKEKELKTEAHLKDAQLKYLQAQINPHFLFNTLNAGAQLAMMEDADKTYQYIQNVADFFRYNIKKDHENVSLRDEIELVDSYIYILNVRFSGEIHFSKTVEENLYDFMIPSMVLQPIIENCVNYGIRGIDWQGEITLEIHSDENSIYIQIKDNGIGMTKEQVCSVMEKQVVKNSEKTDSNGIGLTNVINRLELYYNTTNVFVIESEGINKGTVVTITIPKKSGVNYV